MGESHYLDYITSSNDTDYPYDKQLAVHQLIEEQAARTPGAVAAVFHQESITYAALNNRANQLAWELRAQGVKPNDIVGLMVRRSLDMLTGMLGIMKAGGCYLPLDPQFPEARIAYMLEDSHAKVLLSESMLMEKGSKTFPGSGAAILIDRELAAVPDGRKDNPDNVNKGSDLIYVIYTSGSTGNPKGVMIEHRNVHNFIVGMKQVIDFAEYKAMLSLTTISFDIFVLESLLPLTLGMKIVIADPMTFADDMAGHRIEMLQTTPSTIRMILNDERNHALFQGITAVILGGEPFPPMLMEMLRNLDVFRNARLYNVYGPTETTVWSTAAELTDKNRITIGRPIANTQIIIMDENRRPALPGEIGEICIAGDGVARGYLFRPELTEERFIIGQTAEQDIRMYCTGDLGRWLPDGELECLGRIDAQVKIRGFRIELGEIQAALLKAEGIEDCVAAVKENDQGEMYLAAYYVAARPLIVPDLILELREQLPEYEIPGIYMKIDKVPLTPNGKVDRRPLPEPQFKRSGLQTPYMEPRSAEHRELAQIWKQILNYDRVGVRDNFFDLGGNSVLVSRLHFLLEKQYRVSLDVADLFTMVTIEQQSGLLKERKRPEGHGQIKEQRLTPFCFNEAWYLAEHGQPGRVVCLSLPLEEEKAGIERLAAALHEEPEWLCLGAYLYLLDQYGLPQEELPDIGVMAFSGADIATVRMARPVSGDLAQLVTAFVYSENHTV